MDANIEWPQIGQWDVEPAALEGEGATLADVVADVAPETDLLDTPEQVPTGGWRVLRVVENQGALLGAPSDERRMSWWLAQVAPPRHGAVREPVRVLEHPFPLRPSRSQRSRGLALRWPDTTRTAPDLDRLAIDVVNVGDMRWVPNGDGFHVVGFLQREDDADTDAGGYFAFVSGQDPAFALDPGEYARVRVHLGAEQWRDAQPGTSYVRATLALLPVRTDAPLTLELTEEVIERHRPSRERTPREEPDPRTGARQRLGIARALLSAHDRLGETVQIVADAESEDAALRGIRKLLECGAEAAQAVYLAPLRRFAPRHRAGLEEEVEALERELRRLDGSGA